MPASTGQRPLTQRQQQCLAAIRAYVDHHRQPPTVRELCAMMGRTPATVHRLVHILEHRGLLAVDRYRVRGIRLLDGHDPRRRLDALERVAAAASLAPLQHSGCRQLREALAALHALGWEPEPAVHYPAEGGLPR